MLYINHALKKNRVKWIISYPYSIRMTDITAFS
jgi:hypothetical protein